MTEKSITWRCFLGLSLALLLVAAGSTAVLAAESLVAWIKFTGVDPSVVNATAADSEGNIYVGGSVSGALPNQVSAGNRDSFIRKYNRKSHIRWTKQFGTSGDDEISGITVGAGGNVFVTGSRGENDIGWGTGFVRKYSPEAKLLWARAIGHSHLPEAVAAGPGGVVYVVGRTPDTLPNQLSAGYLDAFLRKYDHRGNIVWTRQFGTADWDDAKGVGVDRNGAVFVAGGTAGALPNQTGGGGMDAYIRKYNSSGEIQWTRQFGGTLFEWAEGVAVDSGGDAYVTGYTSAGAFVRKYGPGGKRLWVRTWDGDWPFDISVDSDRNVYVAGKTRGFSDFSKSFVVKYSPQGTGKWINYFARGVAYGTTVDTQANLYVGGTRSTSLWGGPVNPFGSDAYLAKFPR